MQDEEGLCTAVSEAMYETTNIERLRRFEYLRCAQSMHVFSGQLLYVLRQTR